MTWLGLVQSRWPQDLMPGNTGLPSNIGMLRVSLSKSPCQGIHFSDPYLMTKARCIRQDEHLRSLRFLLCVLTVHVAPQRWQMALFSSIPSVYLLYHSGKVALELESKLLGDTVTVLSHIHNDLRLLPLLVSLDMDSMKQNNHIGILLNASRVS